MFTSLDLIHLDCIAVAQANPEQVAALLTSEAGVH